MVNLIRFWLFFIPTICLAANLELDLSSHQVEMGKHIIATLNYQGKTKPADIDLSFWEKDFYIQKQDYYAEVINAQQFASQTILRLYPRRIGDLTLDSIAQGGAMVKPIHIQVKPSIRKGIDGTPKLTKIKTTYWADEVFKVSIAVNLHHPSNKITTQDWTSNNFSITKLPQQKQSSPQANTVLLSWLLYAPQAGAYELEPPLIMQQGRGRFHYYLAKLKLNIKPLPAYYPASIAVGKINIESVVNKGKNKQNKLSIQLSKQGFLPKQIEGMESYFNLDYKQSQHDGVTTRTYQINVPEWQWGQIKKLELTYFNPQTAMLDVINHTLPIVWAIPIYAQRLGFILLLIITFLMVLYLRNWLKQKRKQVKFQQLLDNGAPTIARRTLLSNNHKSLTHWASQQDAKDAKLIAEKLNKACFKKLKK